MNQIPTHNDHKIMHIVAVHGQHVGFNDNTRY